MAAPAAFIITLQLAALLLRHSSGAAAGAFNYPTLDLIKTAPVPMVLPSPSTAFEGGTLLRTASGLHLFLTDVTRGIVNTSLVYYRASGQGANFTFVREVACCSSGRPGDPKGSLWAPMPAWDAARGRWQLFYVMYKAFGPGHEQDPNWHGQIMHARSVVPGDRGLGGPFEDVGVVLRPDNSSQAWEGLQGADSISPPFLLPDNTTWSAFYGSSGTMGQRNGLVTAPKLGAPFVRRRPSALVDFNNGRSETPVVTSLEVAGMGRVFVAVFDTLKHDPPPHGRSQQLRGFGITWSRNGIDWSPADVVDVGAQGARTPLRLLPEADGTVSVWYTICPCGRPVPERVWHATFNLLHPSNSSAARADARSRL